MGGEVAGEGGVGARAADGEAAAVDVEDHRRVLRHALGGDGEPVLAVADHGRGAGQGGAEARRDPEEDAQRALVGDAPQDRLVDPARDPAPEAVGGGEVRSSVGVLRHQVLGIEVFAAEFRLDDPGLVALFASQRENCAV
jgi:hypothetical protein